MARAFSFFASYGEQIDGAFTFQGIEYLIEAKWQNYLTPLGQSEA
jgi:hypothetical protein